MNLYLVSRTDSVGYDEYDAFVVASESAEQAKLYSPEGGLYTTGHYDSWSIRVYNYWSVLVEVTLVATATDLPEGHIVLASFNAG